MDLPALAVPPRTSVVTPRPTEKRLHTGSPPPPPKRMRRTFCKGQAQNEEVFGLAFPQLTTMNDFADDPPYFSGLSNMQQHHYLQPRTPLPAMSRPLPILPQRPANSMVLPFLPKTSSALFEQEILTKDETDTSVPSVATVELIKMIEGSSSNDVGSTNTAIALSGFVETQLEHAHAA